MKPANATLQTPVLVYYLAPCCGIKVEDGGFSQDKVQICCACKLTYRVRIRVHRDHSATVRLWRIPRGAEARA